MSGEAFESLAGLLLVMIVKQRLLEAPVMVVLKDVGFFLGGTLSDAPPALTHTNSTYPRN